MRRKDKLVFFFFSLIPPTVILVPGLVRSSINPVSRSTTGTGKRRRERETQDVESVGCYQDEPERTQRG